MRNPIPRRDALQRLATLTAAAVLLPQVSACGSTAGARGAEWGFDDHGLPLLPPSGFDAVAFNRDRGLQGAIPQTYHASITGPGGDAKHLGKHLPYLAPVDPERVPAGYLAIMWGDPNKGHAKHPNADRGPANNNEGHWYNWIRVRKATDGPAEELKSAFSGWPEVVEGDEGAYLGADGAEPSSDGGRNTVYLVALPSDVHSGDRVRIWAHCLTHGEYLDFLQIA